MPGRLATVLKRFADRAIAIQREILRNPDFRILCEDYGDAVAALERWSESNDDMAFQRTSEYRHLVEELELEISNHLQTLPPS